MRYELTITTDYVSKWDLWTAIRELLQNAIDIHTDRLECEIVYQQVGDCLLVGNKGTHLERDTLLFGKSTKRDRSDLIGEFGEGYKLAIIVLLRLGYSVVLYNGQEQWNFCLEDSQQFPGNQILAIYVEKTETVAEEQVVYCIDGLSKSDIDEDYYLPEADPDTILDNVGPGRIYIGGLFITKIDNLEHSYNFAPGSIRLERDRQLASEYDIAWITAKINSCREAGNELLDNLLNNKLDTYYLENYATMPSAKCRAPIIQAWRNKFGDDIPVSSNEEVAVCTNAGIAYRIVNSRVANILRSIKEWVLPEKKSPYKILKEWSDRFGVVAGQVEFNSILEKSKSWH